MSKSRIHGRKGQPYGNLIKLPEAPPKNARPPFGSQGDITHGLSIPANSTGIEAETHERRLSADSAGSGSGGTASEDEAGHLLSAMPSPANPTNPDIKKPKGKRAANATPAEPQKTQFSARG